MGIVYEVSFDEERQEAREDEWERYSLKEMECGIVHARILFIDARIMTNEGTKGIGTQRRLELLHELRAQ